MLKPLRSTNPQPRDIQFKHFGVLELEGQSKGSLFTSVVFNLLLAAIFVILSAAAVKINADNRAKEVTFVAVKPLPPPKPKIVPPKPIPKPPVIKPVEPKIVLTKVTPPVLPKPVPVPVPKPVPVVTPAPPKAVVAAAAPKPMPVHLPTSASVVNNNPHPTAVALGSPNNPIAPSNRPATAAINLGQRGLPGMPATNSGGGPPSTRVNLGSGQPGGSINGTGSRAVQGVKLGGVTNGTPGGTGNGVGTRPAQVALGQAPPPRTPAAANIQSVATRTGPQVIYKPRPTYTDAATKAGVEGAISVRIHVSSTGAVTVLGLSNDLGYGLGQAAIRAAQATRFKPAMDANGHPIDWEGTEIITFQLAG